MGCLRAARKLDAPTPMAKNPLQFINEVRQEAQKVTWPSWREVWITTIMVLIMVTISALFFMVADLSIAYVIKTVLGIG
jgi:preprotein translocase subunit SecE